MMLVFESFNALNVLSSLKRQRLYIRRSIRERPDENDDAVKCLRKESSNLSICRPHFRASAYIHLISSRTTIIFVSRLHPLK